MPLPLTGKLTFTSATPPDLRTCTRAEIKAYFENTYDLDESLFQGISDEAFYTCPDRLRLPLIFYYVHPAVVYVNKLMLANLMTKRPNPKFEALFETGVDEMSWDDTENFRMGGQFQWPDLQSSFQYRKQVRQAILSIIDTAPLALPVNQDSPWWTLFLGFEHERIHLETSSVLMRQLPIQYVSPPRGWTLGPREAPAGIPVNEMVAVADGQVTLGKPEAFPSFGWDNEYGKVEMSIPSFEVFRFVITNGEYLAFVMDGGYRDQRWWSAEGWRWLTFRKARHPTFWVCRQGCPSGCGSTLAGITHCPPVTESTVDEPASKKVKGEPDFRYRTVFEVIDMPWSWPADVNYLEAKAYCAWRGQQDNKQYRLPTEAEYALLRDPVAPADALSLHSEIIYQKDQKKANVNMICHSSTPVNLYPPTKSGVYDIHGNVWQWVEDHFNGLPGFKTHYLYDDFSSPCFDARHTMIVAGSFISTGDEASRFARFAFRRHFFQHCGFRLVHSAHKTPARLTCMPDEAPLLEDVPNVSEDNVHPSTNLQLRLDSVETLRAAHAAEYGDRAGLSRELANLVSQASDGRQRALVIGASAGSLPLTMSGTVPSLAEIIAVDYWSKGVEFAVQVAKSGAYTDPSTHLSADLPAGAQPGKVTFKQLTWIPQELGSYDLCVFNNFLHRALNPVAWFPRMREVCRPQGVLVVLDPQFTAEQLQSVWGKQFALQESKVLCDAEGSAVYYSVWSRTV